MYLILLYWFAVQQQTSTLAKHNLALVFFAENIEK